MIKVITYGTFDLLHDGHINLLRRAKELGDYLVVGVTTESYDESRGKLNVHDNLMTRIENVKKTGYVDEIVIEQVEGQKISDIQSLKIDVFAIGSDWLGKFDYLNEFCKVVYLERTKGISSTQLRAKDSGILRLGMIGYGRIASRFVVESKFVSGVNIECVMGRNELAVKSFAEKNEIAYYETDLESMIPKVDAVYIASPNLTHYEYIKMALNGGKHVLCEKPMCLSRAQTLELFDLAQSKNLVLFEAIKTACSPGFLHLIAVAKSGIIGDVKSIDATFTKLTTKDCRELHQENAGGSVTELASYPLLVAVKLLGLEYESVNFVSYFNEKTDVDMFTHILMRTKHTLASLKVGLGIKSEGDLIISGTEGYIYVPAPWWKTEYFEIRYEDQTNNRKYFYKFEGEGLRYELAEFLTMINKHNLISYKLTPAESVTIAGIIEDFRNQQTIVKI